MKFIFWQNILSIHQSSFIRSLSDESPTYLVVEKGLNNTRINHGWNIPDFGRTQVIVQPSEEQISQLLAIVGAVHIFTGIVSFQLPTRVFKMAIKQKLNIGVMLEPFNVFGFKGKLRILKYKFLALKYRSKIDFILAISDNAMNCYKKIGFNDKNIFDWIYFTEKANLYNCANTIRRKPRLLFIGSIDDRKNILPTVNVVLHYEDKIDSFHIVGVGSLENKLKHLIQKSEKIKYIGSIPNKLIGEKIADADLLILPSIFDGWGAVINESLQLGTPVLVSEDAGASCLINNERGRVFSNHRNNLSEIFNIYLDDLPINYDHRLSIKKWANLNLSGEEGVHYFTQIINNVYNNKPKPVAPWKKERL